MRCRLPGNYEGVGVITPTPSPSLPPMRIAGCRHSMPELWSESQQRKSGFPLPMQQGICRFLATGIPGALAGYKLGLERIQLAGDAVIHHLIANLDYHTTQDRGVSAERDFSILP